MILGYLAVIFNCTVCIASVRLISDVAKDLEKGCLGIFESVVRHLFAWRDSGKERKPQDGQ
jgi:hypothetical protein